jgi:hypothetical protein
VFEPPVPVELEFRDGPRQVPEYLAALMKGIETYRLTYDQAVDQANKRMQSEYLNRQQDAVLKSHFKGPR